MQTTRAARADRIVSSDDEELILVDADDRATGYLSKGECHDGDGVLHRAFSVFLFNDDGELLLQQRAGGKRLWPLFWSNSCCSHPRRGEDMTEATARRLEQELGISAALEFVFKFSYRASFGDAGTEHELCWVYLGRAVGAPAPNGNEIESLRWIDAATLDRELAANAERYTPWLRLEWRKLKEEHAATLAGFTRPPAGRRQPT